MPPMAGRAHSGRFFQAMSHRSSILYTTVLNVRPIRAATTARAATRR